MPELPDTVNHLLRRERGHVFWRFYMPRTRLPFARGIPVTPTINIIPEEATIGVSPPHFPAPYRPSKGQPMLRSYSLQFSLSFLSLLRATRQYGLLASSLRQSARSEVEQSCRFASSRRSPVRTRSRGWSSPVLWRLISSRTVVGCALYLREGGARS